MILKNGLYIVSTPIGNLGDITYRAVETLKSCDLILCEDTRVSMKLLSKYGISNKLSVYNDKSDEHDRIKIKLSIQQGKSISLISDAGTPLVSDPGYKLVRDLKSDGIYIDIVPGPCSVIAALSISTLPSDQFLFAGFVPKSGSANFFRVFEQIEATLIFFESANRLIKTIDLAIEVFGDRMACAARELTKLYQDITYDSLSNLKLIYGNKNIKGEIVLLISGYKTDLTTENNWQIELKELIKNGSTAKSACTVIQNKYKLSKTIIYKVANVIKKS